MRRDESPTHYPALPPASTTATVTIPLSMKVPVATRESLDSRDIQQTPWPLVHPEPMRVPIIEGKLGIRAAGLFAEDKVDCVTTVSRGLDARHSRA